MVRPCAFSMLLALLGCSSGDGDSGDGDAAADAGNVPGPDSAPSVGYPEPADYPLVTRELPGAEACGGGPVPAALQIAGRELGATAAGETILFLEDPATRFDNRADDDYCGPRSVLSDPGPPDLKVGEFYTDADRHWVCIGDMAIQLAEASPTLDVFLLEYALLQPCANVYYPVIVTYDHAAQLYTARCASDSTKPRLTQTDPGEQHALQVLADQRDGMCPRMELLGFAADGITPLYLFSPDSAPDQPILLTPRKLPYTGPDATN